MREEFENLEVISKRFNGLHPTIVWFCEKENKYASSFEGFQEMVHWLNGAYCVFQELNKIDDEEDAALQKEAEGWECAREAMFRPYKRD